MMIKMSAVIDATVMQLIRIMTYTGMTANGGEGKGTYTGERRGTIGYIEERFP